MEVSVFAGGHGIAGNRRGASTSGMSSEAQMNRLRGDSPGATGVLYSGAGCFFSMTDRGHHVSGCSYVEEFGGSRYIQSSSPMYKLLIAVSFRTTSCAICDTAPRVVNGTKCGVEIAWRPGMANVPTRGANTGAVEPKTLKVISEGADGSSSMAALLVIEWP